MGPQPPVFFFLTREKGVKLHSRNRGGPVWLGRLLDGLEMTLRCTEPGLMPPWAPERSSHWQPIRAQFLGSRHEFGPLSQTVLKERGGCPTCHPDHADSGPSPAPSWCARGQHDIPSSQRLRILPDLHIPPGPIQAPLCCFPALAFC